ncbi:MAG TPA: hypothetical protein VK205_14435 [Prolixibacteraceae bacterium]|nr:hypothetical protein [Prolixibacteraceae bacterium]
MEKLMTNAQFNELVEKVIIVPIEESKQYGLKGTSTVDETLEHLGQYWKIAKPILKVIKLITPPKIDKAIDEILAIVSKLCSSPTDDEKSELLEKFAKVWGTVKPVLTAAKAITGKKVDLVIDEIIKIGDMLTAAKKAKREQPTHSEA